MSSQARLKRCSQCGSRTSYCFFIGVAVLVARLFVAGVIDQSLSALIPLVTFEGEWYGPGVQQLSPGRARLLRRLVQTQRLAVVRHPDQGGDTLTATKLDGDWERGDVGAHGEMLWHTVKVVDGFAPGQSDIRVEVQLLPGDVNRGIPSSMCQALLRIVSSNELRLVVQGKSYIYRRAGAIGLESIFSCVEGREPALPLRRVLFDFKSLESGAPSLLPSAVPAVDISHIWRARGAVVVAVLPCGADGDLTEVLPADVLVAVRAFHGRAPSKPNYAPRLVLVWPGFPEEPLAIRTLAAAKDLLGPSTEVYGDESGRIMSRLAHEADEQVLIAAVAPSGDWCRVQIEGALSPKVVGGVGLSPNSWWNHVASE